MCYFPARLSFSWKLLPDGKKGAGGRMKDEGVRRWFFFLQIGGSYLINGGRRCDVARL